MIKIYNKHINQVKQEFLNKNLFPLFDDYNGNKQKLLAQTPEGYLVVTSFRYLTSPTKNSPTS